MVKDFFLGVLIISCVIQGAMVNAGVTIDDDPVEETHGYKTPTQVDLKTIQDLDADDEALVKYKAALLGQTGDVLDEGGQNVLVKSLSIVVDGRPDIVIDLTGDISTLKKSPVAIKEGTIYRLKIGFRIQREIVSGLRYYDATYRKGIRVDKRNFMVGSYGPRTDVQYWVSPPEDAPTGMLLRGTYLVKSKFTDDDKNIYLQWEWAMKISAN